jgi:hypothetical protein
VDLDGTLIRSDMLWESMLRWLRQNPFGAPVLLPWWLQGRARLKARLAARVVVDPAPLPYQEDFLAYLREQARAGRRLILATASDRALALPVAQQVGLFAETLASDGQLNLRGANKGRVLAERFGERGFDYAGNSSVDVPVWARARQAIVVNGSARLVRRAAAVTTVGGQFGEAPVKLASLWSVLRPLAWLRNVLVFAPLVLATEASLAGSARRALLAFAALSLGTSAVAVLKGLVELDADRADPARCQQALASARLPLSWGLATVPLLLFASVAVALLLSLDFLAVPPLFFAVAVFWLGLGQRFALSDILLRASLNLLRLLGGHAAIGTAAPKWWVAIWAVLCLGFAIMDRTVRRAKRPSPLA